ncbi:MAG TPA: amino acid adenylation domain-containing protein [Thermoanaerobaculia bacterium]|nr:amino acid adenylation domain-containing protein [Thermoanaerobaculia bacterium]
MNLPWFPAIGGANKCNRVLAEGLAALGHSVRVVVPALGVPSRLTLAEWRNLLAVQGFPVGQEEGVDVFSWNGVEVHAVAEPSRLRAVLAERLRELRPDWALVSSEDPSQNLLDAALKAQAAPVVYLAHTPAFLPFGPQAFYPSERRGRMLAQVAGIVTVSRYMADYIRCWGTLNAEVFHFPVYGPGPFPDFGTNGEGFVTLINPCAVKGIAILLGLARELPEVRFAAVPTWGTTAADCEALAALSNVTLLEPEEEIDRIFARTRVLLMPSLWQEAFGLTAVEAMLRGLPVLASDVGGLPEATLGAGRVLPVRPIERFLDRQDDNEVTEAVVPEQDLAPWREALLALLGDAGVYAAESAGAREAAHGFVAGLDARPFVEILERTPRRMPDAAASEPAPAAAEAADGGVAGLTPEQRALLMLRLRKKAAQKETGPPPIPRAPRDGDLPLSFAQQRLWFLDQWEPGNPAYNIPAAVQLAGDLDVPAFAAAMAEIVRRHEALRTTFPAVEGRPRQVIAVAVDLPVPVLDLSSVPDEARSGEVRRLALEHALRPFDLAQGPLFRVALVRMAPREHVTLVNMHHIVSDGWSVGVLTAELGALYAAFQERRPPSLPPLRIQYVDFAVWQRDWLQGERLEAQLAYWRERLADAPPALELPADRPRPAVRTFRGGRSWVTLPARLWSDLKTFSRRQGTTPFMTALAGFKALLTRVTGQLDVAVGTPIANRNREEMEKLIGFFVNTLVLRTDLSDNPGFREMVDRVREGTLGAYAHQDLPFEEVVKAANAGRDLSRNPLFQVMFALHNAPGEPSDMPGIAMDFLPLYGGTAKFDFDLMAVEADDGLGGAVEYNADLFDGTSVARLLAHWRTLLAGALADPERRLAELPLLDAPERHQIVAEWNNTEIQFPRDATLDRLFAEQRERDPGAPAVLTLDGGLSYAELDARAGRLAGRLRALGVRAGDRVGISVERSPALVVGLLGIAQAGGAYVPLDPAYPSARMALMLEDARVRALITQESLRGQVSAGDIPLALVDLEGNPSDVGAGLDPARVGASPTPTSATAIPESHAYVIYTSGSTGTPKGVMLDHRGRVNNFLDFNRRFGVGPGDALLAVSSLSFDMTAYDVFGTLAAGAAVVMPAAADMLDPARWAELIAHRKVTVWHSAPALLELLVGHVEAQGGDLSSLRLVLLGGDWIPLSLPVRLRRLAPGATVISMGGATEVSMDSTIFRIDEVEPQWTSIPYGRPMMNQRAHVVDAHLRPAPVNVPGELLLGGIGVGHGYFARPELTAERFIPDPFSDRFEPGGRLYRTGDLARFRPDGNLELLGRIDFQVKIRGVRIELGEIVAALNRHEEVKEAVVVARRDGLGMPRLIGYYVPRAPDDTATLTPAGLADYLRARLPEPMVPTAWVELAALPLSPNGKVDRRALPDPEPGAASGREAVPPRTAVERVIAGVWEELLRPLGVERVGALDSFFELGGHSLLATQVVSRLRAMLPVEVSLKTMLEMPTVAGTAAAVEALGRADGIDMEEVAEVVLQLNELSEDEVRAMLAARAEESETSETVETRP